MALNSPASEVVQRHLADPFKAKMQPVNKIITSMKRDKHLLMSSPMILLAVYRVNAVYIDIVHTLSQLVFLCKEGEKIEPQVQ